MSGWTRCGQCRKVLAADLFDDGSAVCRPCLTAPEPRKRAASPVTRTTAKPRATKPEVEPGPRVPRLGAVGSGDLEVRERRALRTAQSELAEAHPEQFAELLAEARRAEGLRA